MRVHTIGKFAKTYHMLAVEACVCAYAKKHNADQDLWGMTALLHDFDYERWPNSEHAADREHPSEGTKILREHHYPEEMIRAILSHADCRAWDASRC